jgi:GTP-binding protein
MAFIDEIQLDLTAGKGGDGVVRWRTEKFKPKSGPGGGNGGRGGSIYAVAVKDLAYLSTYQFKKDFTADPGSAGENHGKHGAGGNDLELKFPVGTVITQIETGFTWQLDTEGQRELLLAGGAGGLGNEYFKSSTNTTPTESTPGKPGEHGNFTIELQLFADIGLVGLPSAGKSSLLNALTSADAKVGAYHFTTLEPNLGVLAGGLVIADIPGLIEGAADGRGLGHKFLRHIRRTKKLVHLVPADNPDPIADYHTIRKELVAYSPELAHKEEIVVLSRCDEVTPERITELGAELSKLVNQDVLAISVYDDESLARLVKRMQLVKSQS